MSGLSAGPFKKPYRETRKGLDRNSECETEFTTTMGLEGRNVISSLTLILQL